MEFVCRQHGDFISQPAQTNGSHDSVSVVSPNLVFERIIQLYK
jgi:hypothetical protein